MHTCPTITCKFAFSNIRSLINSAQYLKDRDLINNISFCRAIERECNGNVYRELSLFNTVGGGNYMYAAKDQCNNDYFLLFTVGSHEQGCLLFGVGQCPLPTVLEACYNPVDFN